MDIVPKTIRVKLRLTPKQEETLLYQASHVRYVWHWGLARRSQTFKASRKGLTYNQQSAELTKHKRENRWLYDTYSDCLQWALKDLDTAFKNFFNKRAKHPRFKAKHRSCPSLKYAKGCVLTGNRLKIPKLGTVRCFNSHAHAPVKSVRVRQTATGEWFATCVTEIVAQPSKEIRAVAGIDLGLKSFAVVADGRDFQDVAPPKFFRAFEEKLAFWQKRLNRCEPGSNNRAKIKRRVAKLHKRVAGLRKNWLHQLSSRLVNEYDGIFLEDLNVDGMKRSNLGKSLGDAALSEFVRQLVYKAKWRGKLTVKIDRWFPSSKLCRYCGTVNKDLTLSDREWRCSCGATHDRDKSAALNILIEGIETLRRSDSPPLNLLRNRKRFADMSVNPVPVTQESHPF